MENNTIDTMYEAICAGDEETLGQCLERATIETVLQFEACKKVSPLHLCLDVPNGNRFALIRRLIASGLVDATQHNSDGFTVLVRAYETGDLELVEQLIVLETDGVDGPTACYRLMRHGSLKLFKKYLTLRNEASEADTFQSIASALVKVNVKNLDLPNDLRSFLHWKLSDYAYRNLVGDWPGARDPQEWMGQMEIFFDCWSAIWKRYNTHMFDDIDDQLLHRLQVIHNHLYFLKNFAFLDHLPLTEVVFCLAIFISIFKKNHIPEHFRLLINKCLIMEFLGMIDRQLVLARDCIEGVSRELKEIMEESHGSDPAESDPLTDLWEKVQSMRIGEGDNWMKGKRKDFDRLSSAATDEKVVIKSKLIKDIQTKIKQLNKSATQASNPDFKEPISPEVGIMKLKAEICTRLPYMASPENVANKLLADVKKGKSSDLSVAEVIASEVIDLKHLVRGKDRAIIRRVKKCYAKTKQLYSLFKTNVCWLLLGTIGGSDRTVFIDTFKRILQVMGESVKNTNKSPNMPGKVYTILSKMLSIGFPILNMLLRETFSHSMTLARTLMNEEIEWRAFVKVRHYSKVVLVMFYLLHMVAVEDARLTLYGMMLRCWSLEQLRSLLVYVGEMKNLDGDMQLCFQEVKSHFDKIKALLDDMSVLPVGATKLFPYIKTVFQEQCKIVTDLEAGLEIHADVGFARVREVSFASKDLRTVRRLLDWILTLRSPMKFFDRIGAFFNIFPLVHSVLLYDVRLDILNMYAVSQFLDMYLGSIKAAEALDYLHHTQDLAQKLGVAVDEDKEKVQTLHKMLEKYYKNIFAVDLKRKILEDFFEVKKRNKNARDGKEAVIDQLIKEDQERLQTLFDERRSRLQAILIQNGLESVESLHVWNPSKPAIIASIEYLTLELTEMLTSVGYFGNSFYYVMHRIPVIQGKNYRNYLAHDGISYGLLSDTSVEIKVLNAYVIANTDIRLFDRRVKPFSEVMRFPSVEDTHRWVAEQDRLMAAFQSRDVGMMHAAIQAGGELRSLFCCSPNHHYPSEYRPLTMLADPCHPGPWITELLSRYYDTFSQEITDPENIVHVALMRRDFEEAFPRMASNQLTGIEQIFEAVLFEWDEVIPRLRGTKLFNQIISEKFKYQALSLLIKSGNERSVREMLHFFPGDIRSDETVDPLNDAIFCGVWSIVELLLAKVSSPHLQSLQIAIITHAPKKIFNTLLGKRCICANDFNCMVKTSIRAKNQVVFALLLEHPNLLQHPARALGECYELAAITPGQHKILQQLLENYPPANPNGLVRILHQAARRQHCKCVRVLLEAGVSTDVVYHNQGVESTTFLLLVRHGQTRLLERVKAVDRVLYGTRADHPLALAVRYGHDTKRMVRVLKRLGFGWFDRSTVLHEKMACCISQSLEQTWTDLDEDKLKRSSTDIDKEDYLSVAFSVLPHWKTIAYVEQLVSGKTALLCALLNNGMHNLKDLVAIKITKERLKYLSSLADVESKAEEIDQLKASITQMEKREKEKLERFTESWQKRSQNSRKGRRINDQLMFATERLNEQPYLEGREFHKGKENLAGFVKRLQNRKETRLNDVKKRSENYFRYLKKGVLASISFQKQRLNQLMCPEYTTSKKQEIDQLKASLRKLERCEAEQRYDLVSTLLDRSQKSRIIEGLGVLSDIVFENNSKIVRLDKEDENQTLYVHTCCENMITRMEILLPLKHFDFWREVTVNLGVSVTFRVLCIADEENEFPPSFDGVCKIPAAASLLDTFIKLRDMCKAVFRSYDVICAHVVTTEAMIYYWQIEELSCAFDVRPPGTTFDIANIINARDSNGKTVLHYYLGYHFATKPQELVFQHRLAKLLLDHGANPLLADDFNAVALNWTMLNSKHPAIAHDAIEACLRRDLRNEQGKTMLEMTPRMRESLIQHCAMNGRIDILERLLGLGVNVNVPGECGETSAHCAVLVPLHTSYRMLKLLLDYDRTLLYMKDVAGRTILHCAAEVESAELMDLIRSYDANLPEVPIGFRSPMWQALSENNGEWTKELAEIISAASGENQ